MPHPENLDHHVVVDLSNFDFHAMDCLRMLAEDKMAKTLADEIIQASNSAVLTGRDAPAGIAAPCGSRTSGRIACYTD